MTLLAPASDRRDKLINIIRQDIENASGYISFSRYMELALYTPELGYYSACAKQFGSGGDFITAPTLSPLFSRCMANQFQSILSSIPNADILEVGAGSGIFAQNVLLELEKKQSLPQRYFIVEISPALRASQYELLNRNCPHLLEKVQWVENCPTEFIGVIFANEVLDALPADCFSIQEGKLYQRSVTWCDDRISWKLTSAPDSFHARLKGLDLPENYASEMNFSVKPWLQSLAQSLAKGVMILCDYGYGRNEYYHFDRTMGTLKCFYQHRANDDPFWGPGLQDISVHVDFTHVAECAVDLGLTVKGYTTQAAFLMACGLLSFETSLEDNAAIKTLLLPSQMGELVKIMALSKNYDPSLQGCTMHDRRRDL